MTEEEVVLDASAFLAYLREEPGGEVVAKALEGGAVISTVNLAEVFTRVGEDGWEPDAFAEELIERGTLHGALLVDEFTYDDSIEAARLRQPTHHLGLSLADRACLALARRLEFPVLTADSAWSGLDLDVEIRLIR
ncbi:MAG: type II toxin-antitoxin system VapC family toxin [Solirubrobacterales bacterium]|nr:type II toxin-antitoxin system VapC family toxin [Solirubrobacterales bacterium]